LIGHEGNSGVLSGGVHLHFDAREGSDDNLCCTGSSVDPYGGIYSPGNYSWVTNPATYARNAQDFTADGFSDTITFNAQGHAIVGPNNRNASFLPLQDRGQVFSWGEIPQTADFSRDGLGDTISFNAQGHAIVGLNNGNGGFQPLGDWGKVFSSGEIPSTGDFN